MPEQTKDKSKFLTIVPVVFLGLSLLFLVGSFTFSKKSLRRVTEVTIMPLVVSVESVKDILQFAVLEIPFTHYTTRSDDRKGINKFFTDEIAQIERGVMRLGIDLKESEVDDFCQIDYEKSLIRFKMPQIKVLSCEFFEDLSQTVVIHDGILNGCNKLELTKIKSDIQTEAKAKYFNDENIQLARTIVEEKLRLLCGLTQMSEWTVEFDWGEQ